MKGINSGGAHAKPWNARQQYKGVTRQSQERATKMIKEVWSAPKRIYYWSLQQCQEFQNNQNAPSTFAKYLNEWKQHGVVCRNLLCKNHNERDIEKHHSSLANSLFATNLPCFLHIVKATNQHINFFILNFYFLAGL
jgi:hypothetical protein